MRNLAEYPITHQEVIDELRQLAELPFSGIGDMRPLILETALAVVVAARDMLDGIEERLKQDPPLKWVTPWDKATQIIQAFDVCNPGDDK